MDQVEELVARIEQILDRTGKKGRPLRLGLHRSVELVLILARQNINQKTAADLFGVSQSTVSRTYRRMMPLIEQALCRHRPPLAEAVRGRVVLIDGTDVPTGNRAGHNGNYSGKRHRQGRAVPVASTIDGTLVAVSLPLPGRTHDRRAFADTGWESALAGNVLIADPAYVGTPGITPRRKSKNIGLSLGDQANNKMISTIRAAVERCIAHLKNWKVIATGYRGRLNELAGIIRIITALEFYRLEW